MPQARNSLEYFSEAARFRLAWAWGPGTCRASGGRLNFLCTPDLRQDTLRDYGNRVGIFRPFEARGRPGLSHRLS